MPKMVQVRNVPEALHRRLKSRAALEGKSLSDYLLGELRELAERPTPAEMRERLQGRGRANVRETPAAALRAERDGR